MGEPLLLVRDLCIRHRSSGRQILDHVSFELQRGECLGLLGPSGAGKSTLARALLRLLPPALWDVTGSIHLNGFNLLTAPEGEMRRFRGARITLVGQEPELALNPVLTVGTQIEEVLRAHFPLTANQRRQQAEEALAAVGLPDPRFFRAPIQELSGGERQRVVLAQALAVRPALLILDEPTSAVDTITQAEVLELLKKLRDSLELALLFITHNPALLSGFTQRALLLHDGRAQHVEPFGAALENS